MTLATQLLEWYDKNARDLPWRKDKNAYKIWVSEIMLQQTRVEVVKDYYQRWMKRFPTLESLARSSEQEVLTYWQGLGYYSRARHLLSGVQEICADYGGKVPDTTTSLRTLAGVGEYTAGAIASIAYNRPVPAIDGNVLRIFSRLFCIQDDITKQATKRKIDALIRSVLPLEQAGDFNQALMDLGSAICIAGHPRCALCPLTNFCEAYAQEVQDVLPVRAPKKLPQKLVLSAGLVQMDHCYLLCQRPSKGLLAGMWEFPTVELRLEESPTKKLQHSFLHDFQQEVSIGSNIFHTIHTFSHRIWDISFYQCQRLSGTNLPHYASWVSPSAFTSLPWAGPHHKVALTLL